MSPFKQVHWGTVKLFMFYCIFVFPREHACIYMFINYNYLLVLDMHQKKRVCSIMFIISIWSNILIIMYHNQDMHQTLEQELDYTHTCFGTVGTTSFRTPPKKKTSTFPAPVAWDPTTGPGGQDGPKDSKTKPASLPLKPFRFRLDGFSRYVDFFSFHKIQGVPRLVTHPWKKATCCLGRWSSLFLFGAIFGLFSGANSQWPLKRAAKISPPNWGIFNFCRNPAVFCWFRNPTVVEVGTYFIRLIYDGF